MNLYDTHTMKRGAILVDVCGYSGEEKIEDWIETVVKELHARLPR